MNLTSANGASTSVGSWIVAVTGASGMRYALRLLALLAELGTELHVIFSEAALRVLAEEENRSLSFSKLSSQTLFGVDFPNITFHNPKDIGACVASGSKITSGMVVVPCSMATLGSIACGVSSNLIHRAADVVLKEGRRLVLVPRETPLSVIHLENMLKLSKLGARIVPAMPGFYSQPKTLQDLVEMMVMKVLDQMGVHLELVQRWGQKELQETSPDKLLRIRANANA